MSSSMPNLPQRTTQRLSRHWLSMAARAACSPHMELCALSGDTEGSWPDEELPIGPREVRLTGSESEDEFEFIKRTMMAEKHEGS